MFQVIVEKPEYKWAGEAEREEMSVQTRKRPFSRMVTQSKVQHQNWTTIAHDKDKIIRRHLLLKTRAHEN